MIEGPTAGAVAIIQLIPSIKAAVIKDTTTPTITSLLYFLNILTIYSYTSTFPLISLGNRWSRAVCNCKILLLITLILSCIGCATCSN